MATVSDQQEPSKPPVWSWNEWDPLEEVIVGLPDGAVVPPLTPEVRACVGVEARGFFERNAGRYWADSVPREHWLRIQAEVAELCRVLELEGATVRRPEAIDWGVKFRTPDFASQGFYSAMPRDGLLVVGDEIIETPMIWRCRYFETRAFRPLLLDYWRRGARWTAAPKPTGSAIDLNYAHDADTDRSRLARAGSFATTEAEPCFDAADFLRAGRDLLGQRSQVTNAAGVEWLRRHLEPRGLRVRLLEFEDPRPMHIDATLCLLRPGLALVNPERRCREPEMFRSAGWELLACPEPEMPASHPMWLGSRWLSMNVLVLDPSRVLVEREELGLQRLLRAHGMTPVPVAMRHCNSIGGGLHCWTLDVRRRGKLEEYF